MDDMEKIGLMVFILSVNAVTELPPGFAEAIAIVGTGLGSYVFMRGVRDD